MYKVKKSKIAIGMVAVVALLGGFQTSIKAQDVPIYPDGNKIEGAWDLQLTYKVCATGAVLFTGQSMISFANGGVLTAITSGAAPATRYPGLGVWRHVGGRQYQYTFKEFRYNADGTSAGKVIAIVEVTHELDDTLTTSAVGKFYNPAGVLVQTICPAGTGIRFTGEQ